MGGAKGVSLFRRGLQLTETEGPRTPNRPLEGLAGRCVTAVCRGLFSYKSPSHKPGKLNAVQLRVTQHKANFSAKHKRDLATKGFAFGNHSLLKKAGENFYFAGTRSREVKSRGYPPSRYVIRVQAQPARLTRTTPRSWHRRWSSCSSSSVTSVMRIDMVTAATPSEGMF